MENFTNLGYKEDNFSKLPIDASKISDNKITKLFDVAKEVNLSDILLNSIASSSSNVRIQAFKNGQSLNIESTNFLSFFNQEKSFLDNLIFQKLNTSIKITNIQFIDNIIFEICQEVSKNFCIPVTCNLYTSPNSSINGLDFHSDSQITFVYQLYGSKKWHFILDRDGFELRKDNSFICDLDKKLCSKEIIINENEILFIPFNSIHRAECLGNTPSVHLTFALNITSRLEAYRFLLSILSKEIEKKTDLNSPLGEEGIENFFNDLNEVTKNLDFLQIKEEYIKKVCVNSLQLLKSGRYYK